MSYIYDLADTWNNAGTTFTAVKMNVTDTASNAASLLMDLQTNTGGAATSRFNVRKDGQAQAVTFNQSGSGGNFLPGGVYVSSNSGILALGGSSNTILSWKAAANLRFGAADAATAQPQILSVQSVVAGTSNTAGANLTITGSQGTGTGAGGSIIFQVAPAGSSGSAQNALATALTIDSTKAITFHGNIAHQGNGFSISTTYFATDNSSGAGLYVRSNTSPNISLGTADDVKLTRDDANKLALRNGTNAQAFRVYNTTDGTNGNWLELAGGAFSGVYPRIAGTGTNSGLIVAGSATGNSAPLYLRFQYNQNGWRIDTAGNLLAETDNSYDIGAATTTRPRNVYAGTSITPGAGVVVASLPTPATGMMARVTNALAPAVGSTVAGGGSAQALVWYNGANWTVIGV